MRPSNRPATGNENFFFPERFGSAQGRTDSPKGREDQPYGPLHLNVGIQNRPILLIVNETERYRDIQLATPGFVQETALQAGSHHVQFRLGHGSFEASIDSLIRAVQLAQEPGVTLRLPRSTVYRFRPTRRCPEAMKHCYGKSRRCPEAMKHCYGKSRRGPEVVKHCYG